MSDILHHSATILGHEGFRSSTVVSSGLGQVLYPAIVESTTFVQQESLHLCVLPGFLSMNGMRFKCLREDLNERFPGDFRQPLRGTNGNESSLVPADFVPPQRTDDCATQIRWRIAVYDDMLKGDLILAGSQLCSFSSLLLGMVCQLLLTPPCEHGSDTPAGDLAQHFKFLSTEDYYTGSSIRSEDYVDHRMLISTQRSYALQLIELHRVRELIGRMQLAVLDASKRSLVIDQVGRYIVMHVDGCIRCALQLCLDYDLRLVIS